MKIKHKTIVASLFTVLWLDSCRSQRDDEFESESTLTVEHSFDSGPDPVFTKRGTITIRSLASGMAHFNQDSHLDEYQQEKLKSLVNSDGTYHIRIPTKAGSRVPYVSTFIKACALYESDLTDLITLNVDQSGSLLGVSLSTAVPYCAGVHAGDMGRSRFTSSVDIVQTTQGPAPETQTYIQKMEAEKAEKAKGQQQDNRSFLAKYWMYIVPFVIFMLIVSSSDPNAQGGGR